MPLSVDIIPEKELNQSAVQLTTALTLKLIGSTEFKDVLGARYALIYLGKDLTAIKSIEFRRNGYHYEVETYCVPGYTEIKITKYPVIEKGNEGQWIETVHIIHGQHSGINYFKTSLDRQDPIYLSHTHEAVTEVKSFIDTF